MTWDVARALAQMRGMEHAARLLLADVDRELVERDSFGAASPRAIGIAATTTVQCALFCEYVVKTFHALLSDGAYKKGHLLATADGRGLYDHLERRFMHIEQADRGAPSNLVISRIRSQEACCPSGWYSNIQDIRTTLQIGAANLKNWRYGYPEQGWLSGRVPKGLFAIAKGLELETRRRLEGAVTR